MIEQVTIEWLREMQQKVHQLAREKGWWDDRDGQHQTAIPIALELFHSEVSELWKGYKQADMQNVGIEAADLYIRILDAAEGFDLPVLNYVMLRSRNIMGPVSTMIGDIHEAIDDACEAWREYEGKDSVAGHLAYALNLTWSIVKMLDLNLRDAIERKHTINKGRPVRHGGKAC